jgi:hypothetical protein
MEKRTVIRLERDPGFGARALDLARSIVSGKPREYAYDGYANDKGKNVRKAAHAQHNREVRLRVQAYDGGAVSADTERELIDGLKICHTTPEKHPILVTYDGRELNLRDYDIKYGVGGMEFTRRESNTDKLENTETRRAA